MDLPNQLNAAGKSATKKLLGRLLATGIAEIDEIIGGSALGVVRHRRLDTVGV
jgi:hypothetical protein